jgi:hypothetical protein
MPIYCQCEVCGKNLEFIAFDESGNPIWTHVFPSESYHEPEVPDDIAEQFRSTK